MAATASFYRHFIPILGLCVLFALLQLELVNGQGSQAATKRKEVMADGADTFIHFINTCSFHSCFFTDHHNTKTKTKHWLKLKQHYH